TEPGCGWAGGRADREPGPDVARPPDEREPAGDAAPGLVAPELGAVRSGQRVRSPVDRALVDHTVRRAHRPEHRRRHRSLPKDRPVPRVESKGSRGVEHEGYPAESTVR